MGIPLLRAESINFAYNGRTVLNNLSLEISEGEFLGILGPNGAGKSTLLRVLTHILRPISGRVTLRGRPLDQFPVKERARHLAVLPAEMVFAYDFTVREIVKMGRAPHLGLWSEGGPEDLKIVEDSLSTVGLSSLADRNIHALSSGERQLVFLAQALAQRPGILFLDEPTVHLDVSHQIRVFKLLREWNREKGLTVLVISHDLNVAAQFCRRLVLLHEGKVVTDGEPAAVITEENLRKVYGIEARVSAPPETQLPVILYR